ncbi:MAG: FtsX-like permease family protein, partial [Planctomycetota bacterium]
MNRGRLIRRGLGHFRATHLGTVLGVAVGTAVLTGALVVGDSVRLTLRERALARIGRIDAALATGERTCRAALAAELARRLPGAAVAPALLVRGIASAGDGARRALDVQVAGIDARFFALAPAADPPPPPGPDEVYLNERLARQLAASPGDRVVLRVEMPPAMPRETALGGAAAAGRAFAGRVTRILGAAELGELALTAGPRPPPTAFVALGTLQAHGGLADRVNLILAGCLGRGGRAAAESALRDGWDLADAGLRWRDLPAFGALELVSDRVLLDPFIAAAVRRWEGTALAVATHLATTIAHGERAAPYALVAAIGSGGRTARGPATAPWDALAPADLGTGEVVIDTWLAEDLGAEVGDELAIRFASLGAATSFETAPRAFRVRAIVPVAGLAADRGLLPPFPGLAEKASCREWDVALPLDLSRLRDRDEEWWRVQGGTPQAFLSLAGGEAAWGAERFGTWTGVRIDRADAAAFTSHLRGTLDPGAAGLVFRDVRGPALAAAAPATDFGGLFLGLSVFLLGAAFLLVALLLALGAQQRATEVGLLLALGFRPATVRGLLLGEGAVLAAAGAIAGAAAAASYARLVLGALATIWRGAVAGAALELHVRPSVLLAGAAASFAVALAAAWLALRREA